NVITAQKMLDDGYLQISASDELNCIDITSDLFVPLQPLQPSNGSVTRCYNLKLTVKTLTPDGLKHIVLLLNVTNELGEPTTSNLKNLLNKLNTLTGNNQYDGVPGLTQCPIPNHGSLLYNFTVNEFGPFVIYNPNDPYLTEYDFEYVITLSEWYLFPTDVLDPILLSPGYRGGEANPISGDISGKGQYNCTTAPTNSCNPNNGIATYAVQTGKKYRFRIINMSGATHYIFSIDEHPLTIIEVDGNLINNVTLTTIPINVAQRYSVILNANMPIKSYSIRALLSPCTPVNQSLSLNYTLNPNVLGILKYEGTNDTAPDSIAYPFKQSDVCSDVNPNILKPLGFKPPKKSTRKFDLVVTLGKLPTTGGMAFINNSSLVANFNYPTNRKIMDLQANNFLREENAYEYECTTEDCKNDAVDIYISVTTFQSHPFHM
ncbi:17273_t:CDS:2, partial [Racocetra fulgida]